MRAYRFTLTIVLTACLWCGAARSQEPDESLESKLGLEPLQAINLIDTTPAPPIGVWRIQKPLFFKAIERNQWVWQPPTPSTPAEPDDSRRRRRPRQPTEDRLPDGPIDPALWFNRLTARNEISQTLADRYLDSESEVLFHARVASPHGDMFLGKVVNPPKLVGRRNLGGVFVDEYVTKFAQLKIYESNPDQLELRIFHQALQKEVFPPGVPVNRKPREITQTQQVCPTLIFESKSSLEKRSNAPDSPAVASAASSTAGNAAMDKRDSTAGDTRSLPTEPPAIIEPSTAEKPYRPARSEVIRFDQRGDHVSFDKNIELGTAFTIEAIIKMDRPGPSMTVVNADGTILSVDSNPEPVVIATYNPNRLRALVPIQAKVWHHIAMVRSGTEWRFFANGTPTGQRSDPRLITDARQLVISRADGRIPFLGDLREVRISDTARYVEAFVPPTELGFDPQTLVLLKAEDVRGDRWPDRGGSGFVGTLHGAEPVVATDLARIDEPDASSMPPMPASFKVSNPVNVMPLEKGRRIFSNRPGQIFTTDPPDRFRSWSFTQHLCFEPPAYEIEVRRPGSVFIAANAWSDEESVALIAKLIADGWTYLDELPFLLEGNQEGTAQERRFRLFSKHFEAGTATLPVADSRYGTVILVPPDKTP